MTRISGWAGRVGLGRKFAVALAVASLASALATYAALSGSLPFGTDAGVVLLLLNLDLVLLLLLGAVVARRLVAIWIQRRRGSVGSRVHTRLVLLFSLVALTPAVIVSVFSAVFFSLGMQAWFSDLVRTAVVESNRVAKAYLEEHQRVIRGDVLAMARDLNQAPIEIVGDSARFNEFVATQALFRNLSEALVFSGGRVLAQWRRGFALDQDPIPNRAIKQARDGALVVLTSEDDDRLRALIKLNGFLDTFLYVGRYVEPHVLNYIDRTRRAVAQYQRVEGQRSTIEITFAMLFVLVALLLLLAAIWVGLTFATRLTRPIAALATAAERVRQGDLAARVPEGPTGDEIGSLSRAFNRMTDQLGRQRDELIQANRQLEARRHFTETVLSGVSAGVIGLDARGRINLPNRSASALLSTDLDTHIGRELRAVLPEAGPLVDDARRRPERMRESQVTLHRGGRPRTLLVRVVADRSGGGIDGFVVTFDDVSDLLSAQRKAAWSDIARRIAHEIKNPLTPIQLSAERLRRKYLGEIRGDAETFRTCVDTIVRQVDDIGRMVDEFSSFARMPAPAMAPADLADVCAEAVALQKTAHPELDIDFVRPDASRPVLCDRRQIGQALTNLLQNAVEAIDDGFALDGASSGGRIRVEIASDEDGRIAIAVEDDGRGLPPERRDRLTEPYVTTREKGTGLGLAIVKKIMEDHGGDLRLHDGAKGGTRVQLIFDTGAGTEAAKHGA